MQAKKNDLIKRRYLRFTKMRANFGWRIKLFNRGNKIFSHSEWEERVFLNSRLLMMHLKSLKRKAQTIQAPDRSEIISSSVDCLRANVSICYGIFVKAPLLKLGFLLVATSGLVEEVCRSQSKSTTNSNCKPFFRHLRLQKPPRHLIQHPKRMT